jgi:hypothetical protein
MIWTACELPWRTWRDAAIPSEDFLLISALGIAGPLWTALYWHRMAIRFEKVWVQQCRATKGIKRRFGAKSALEYLIREKLLNFAQEAERRPEFARELPRFLAEVWRIFNEFEIAGYVASLKPKQRKTLQRLLYVH